jgi:ATP-binding cassette, subfamily B, bacterial MsbA
MARPGETPLPVTNFALAQDPWAVWKRLLTYARPHWAMFALGVFGMAVFAGVDTAMAWWVKKFLDGTFVERNPEMLLSVPAGLVALFAIRGVGDYLSSYAPGYVGRKVIQKLRGDLFRHYLDLPTAYYDRETGGSLLSRLTFNTELVAEAATNAVTVFIRDTLTIIGLLFYIFWLNWRLAAFAFLIAPVIASLIRIVNRAFRRYSTRIQGSMGDVTRVAKEAIDGHRLVKVFNAQEHQAAQFAAVNEHNRFQNMKLIQARAFSNPTVQLITALALSGVLYVAIRGVLAHTMTVGDFMSFLTGLMLVTAPLRRLVQIFGPLQQGIAAGASVFEMLDTPIEDRGGLRPLGRAVGEVEFRDVRFTYDAAKGEVLKGVSFAVRAGQTVAIVGRSGGGKSTLVGMLPRFHDPEPGSVQLDGHDVREYSRVDLRRNVSLVSQDVILVNGSIRENIVYSTTEATAEQVLAAARAAHVLEFAEALPLGLDSQVGDRGALLSGGQKQRIAIARALLKNAPVLILDEATSALDTESERIIQDALEELKRGRTTLVIAHRLSTIEHADLIVVVDEGRSVEQGTHAELLARGGAYAALHRMRFDA